MQNQNTKNWSKKLYSINKYCWNTFNKNVATKRFNVHQKNWTKKKEEEEGY